MADGQVIAVASAKGGVGKTTTSINLGTAAVETGNRSTLLIEADLPMANVADFLDLPFGSGRDPTLHDVLAGTASAESAIVTAESGLDVLPSGDDLDSFAAARPDELTSVVEDVRDRYDIVILDTAAGVSRATLIPMALASGVVAVATPRVSAIRDTHKTIDIVGRIGGSTLGVIITRTGTGSAPPAERLARFLGVPLLGTIPDDQAVPQSQDAGKAVVTYDPGSPAASGYFDAAKELGFIDKIAAGATTDLQDDGSRR